MSAAPRAPECIYHLCRKGSWGAAQRLGHYAGGPHGKADGFLHLSTADQVVESAARHFGGVSDLVLLTVDPGALGPGLRWEASRGGALFPHLYDDLPLKAVLAVDDLPLGPDGRHVFPVLQK